jgi:hypothetical protein
LGVLIENKPAKEIEKEIEAGKYDKEINSGKTETPAAKKKELDEYFSNVKKEQDRMIKQEQAAKESAEAAAKAATPTASTPAVAPKSASPTAKPATPAKKK